MNIYFRHVSNRGELEVVGDYDNLLSTQHASITY